VTEVRLTNLEGASSSDFSKNWLAGIWLDPPPLPAGGGESGGAGKKNQLEKSQQNWKKKHIFDTDVVSDENLLEYD